MQKLLCKLCHQEFFINNFWRHLKSSHFITPVNYYQVHIAKTAWTCLNPSCDKPTKFIGLILGFQNYCSHQCAYAKKSPRQITIGNQHRGKTISEEQKKILRKRRGWNHTQEAKEKIALSKKGICRPVHVRQRVSETILRKGSSKGARNPMWKGGIARSPYKNFDAQCKEIIKKRDGYQCQLCKKSKKILAIHHIDYSKGNSHPSNLITLCNSCHSKTNASRKSWLSIFSEMMRDQKYTLKEQGFYFVNGVFDYRAYYFKNASKKETLL